MDFENGSNRASEDAFAYTLYGVTAAELAAMIDTVCKPQNRKFRNEGKVWVNSKYVADLLGTTITVLVRSASYEDAYERNMAQRMKLAGIANYTPTESTPIREYQITTDEWDVNCKIHVGSVDSHMFEASSPRGLGVIEGRKSTVSKPWFDGDVDTYLSQMSILRLMIPMMMEDAA